MTMFTDLDNSNFDEVFKFSSDLQNLSFADSVLTSISDKIDISPDIFGNILLSLSEAINNAIVHGNLFLESKSVYVSYKISPNELALYVKDEGAGFDYKLIDDPTDEKNLEKLTGRGVFIILNLADVVEFSYDKGQVVKMIFNI